MEKPLLFAMLLYTSDLSTRVFSDTGASIEVFYSLINQILLLKNHLNISLLNDLKSFDVFIL